VEDVPAGSRVLDVGGGPGNHAAVWAEAGMSAIVLDPSLEMLAVAAGLPGVGAVAGVSQGMPFRDAVFELVMFHLSIHYGDWRRALDEALRVLRPGGSCLVWTHGPAHVESSMLTRWFPTVGDIDSRRFPDPAEVATYLAARGTAVTHDTEVEQVVRTAGDWERAVRAGFVSTLQLVSATELERGLNDFRAAHPDPDEPVAYRLGFDRICAVRRPLPLDEVVPPPQKGR
jgi:ubiquinone/menaquinone biosynthesis C-methylase UbiE